MQAFEAWLEAFFASYFRRRPVNATFIGMHDYDGCLPDFSENGIADTLADAEDLLRRLPALAPEISSGAHDLPRLAPQGRTDAQIATEPSLSERGVDIDWRLAEGFLRIQRWESVSRHFGPFNNPTQFTGEAIFGLISLLLPGQPARLDAARARLEAVPRFIEVGMRQIRSAPQEWIERGRRECQGARLLLRDVGAEYGELTSAARRAQDAFASFDTFLSTLQVTDEYAAGREAFELVVRAAHFAEPDAVEELALDRVAQEEAALREPGPPADPHPGEADYLERFEALWNQVHELTEEHHLLTFPDWPVRFVDRPSWAHEASAYLYFLPYRSPPPYDAPAIVHYLVPPDCDDSTIKLNHVVHHGGLGHQVQNWFAARAPSCIGRVAAVDCASRIAMLCGGSMAEGWATYATDLVDEFFPGFLTPAERYGQHRARLRMAARAVVDLRLHEQRFTLDEAINFYTQRVGMPPAHARAEAVKNSLFPGAACMYLLGWNGIWRLRRELESRQGSAFQLREFHDRLLSFGSVPVSLIAQAMLGTATVPALSTM
jgi:Bacterial protein of unknown function (DUF885)